MRRANKIDIVCTFLLQFEHNIYKLIRAEIIAISEVAYGIILAIFAGKIAKAEKNCARTFGARYWRLLAKMQIMACDTNLSTSFAKTRLILLSINSAFPRTKSARF